jgi:hypothetical protein
MIGANLYVGIMLFFPSGYFVYKCTLGIENFSFRPGILFIEFVSVHLL